MKKTVFYLWVCFSINRSHAQKVSYSILENNPYRSNLHVTLLPFYVDIATKDANLSIGYAAEASFVFKKLATVNFYMESPYSGRTDLGYHFGTVGIFGSPTENALKKFRHLEFGGTFHLTDHVKETARKVVLHSSRGGNYTYIKYTMVPTTVRKILGLRGGAYAYHTVITARKNGTVQGDLGSNGVISADGTRFGGAANLNGVFVPEDPFFNTESATNMNVLGGYVGISKTSYFRIIIDADDYGRRGHEAFLHFYADFIVAPPIIEPFIGKDGTTYELTGGSAAGFKTRPYGARAGYEYTTVKKRVGMYVKTEAGFKPGLANSKFYCVFAWGVTFNARIKKLNAEPEAGS